MRGKSIKHISVVIVLLILAFGVGRLSAAEPSAPSGGLDSPGPPETTTSYTLEDIYNRLDAGTAGAQSTFTEPGSGPTVGTGHTLDEIMVLAPAEDNTNGATAADVLAGKTFWGLTDGQWGVVTGTRPAATLPKTGQTQCYTTTTASETSCPAAGYLGQDGEYQKGVAWPNPRFITSTMGTVTDTLTGLIWLTNANCATFFSADTTGQNNRIWSDALTAANSLANGYCGLTDGSNAGDWRLPNVRELQSLVDYGRYAPALPSGHPFTDVQWNYHWSSATGAYPTSNAWNVHMSDGYVSHHDKANTYYVWPVRGGQ